jgi:hypothetical protein
MRLISVLIVTMFLFSAAIVGALPKPADDIGTIAHEWGTFTSIAGIDGLPVKWRAGAYSGEDDLPCFVERYVPKTGLEGTVRMETPVLYFYSAKESAINVKVSFPDGTISKTYPKVSRRMGGSTIEWRNVRVQPGAMPDFPIEGGHSHYYAARETDAAPLQIGSQKEKFLFYRGIGTFPLPLSAKVMEHGVIVRNLTDAPISNLMLFENLGGRLRYQLARKVEGEMTLGLPSSQDNLVSVLLDLERILIEQGLYPREAHAMIETWRDSWFEEGARLIYIMPSRTVDGILPLEIEPAPHQMARVFVGRMELITPAIEEDVRQAIAANDGLRLAKYGRFLEPIANRMRIQNSPLLQSIYSTSTSSTRRCSR